MANTKQAKKRARQSESARQANASKRSNLRTHIKKVRAAVASKDLEAAKAAFQTATPVIDRMATKRIIHKNTAARFKSRLNSDIKELAGK